MSVQKIPVVGGNEHSLYLQRTALDGKEYVLRFAWHDRAGVWKFGLYDQEDVPIVVGLALVQGTELLSKVTDERRPPGELYLVNTTGGDDPGVDDLGESCILLYYDAEEIAEELEVTTRVPE